MKIIHKLSEYTKSLFSKKYSAAVEVDIYQLLDLLDSPSHIEKINNKSETEFIKLLKDASKNKLNSIFIAQDLAKILSVDNRSIEVKELTNLLKREHNRKAIFNLLRVNNEYITTKEGLNQLILKNIKKNPKVIEDLLSNAKTRKLLFKHTDNKCLLNYAIECSEDKIVELLVENGTPVDMSTLYHCIEYGKFEIFDSLTKVIKNELLIGKKYHKSFDYAIKYERYDIINMILCNVGTNLKDSKDQTFLHHAVELKNFKIAKQLIKKDAKLNCVDQSGCMPLNLAIKLRDVDITNLLLDEGADIKYTHSPNEKSTIRVYTKEDCEFFIPLLNKRNNPWVTQKNPNTALQQVDNVATPFQKISVV